MKPTFKKQAYKGAPGDREGGNKPPKPAMKSTGKMGGHPAAYSADRGKYNTTG